MVRRRIPIMSAFCSCCSYQNESPSGCGICYLATMTSCPHPPTHVPTEGPITQARDAAEYLERHNIAGLLNGMMSALMMSLPEDPVDCMRRAVNSAREMGLDNVDWHTFVWPLHPHNDPLRRKLLNPPVQVLWSVDSAILRLLFSQPSIYIDGWLYGMSMTSVTRLCL